MTTRKDWTPHWTAHPGEVVGEAQRERGLTQRQFAEALDVSAPYLSDIIAGKRAISARFALRLERIGIGSADLWVRMQAHYDLFLERQKASRPSNPPPGGEPG